MKNVLIAVMAVLFVLAGSSTAATTLWSHDFEDSGLGGGWKDNGGNGVVAVVANPSGSGEVLHLKSPDTSDWACYRAGQLGSSLNENSEFHVEFDVYFPDADVSMNTWTLWACDDWHGNGEGAVLGYRWTETHTAGSPTDYTFDYRDDADWHQVTNSNIVTATWTKVYIDANANSDGNYDVHIGSYANKIGTWDLKDGEWSWPAYFGERSGSSYSGEMYMDNIVITDTAVPEPATMTLLCLGGLGVLIRRRRA